ncbi:hypothetical protein WR25_21980 [Diploscapter pachys]|uniref:Anoctamin n=1 Tax=Diploscapter pachys TaxID=2018661 RepID=A0A2A2L9J9_9BILA|nr:hypothetical protein WR25_21980 [Diploscapter pachys]
MGDLNKADKFTESYKEILEKEWDRGRYFSDGKKEIDFVLVWQEEDRNAGPNEVFKYSWYPDEEEEDKHLENKLSPMERRARYRGNFEKNLKKMDLQLEHVAISPELGNTRFTLVHAPFEVLEKQAQLLRVELPVMESDIGPPNYGFLRYLLNLWLSKRHILDFDEETNKKLNEPSFFTQPYSVSKRETFINWDHPEKLFPRAERVRMVYDMLSRAHYGDSGIDFKTSRGVIDHRFGITRLLETGTYTAAFPLHQELRDRAELPNGPETHREMLFWYWASWRSIFKYQPLDLIKRYFGTKLALYFAWLGYYTRSLIFASIIGVLCVIFGMWNVKEDTVSNDICGSDGIGARTLICPQCDYYCDFQRLNSSCTYSKISYLFDNSMTVIFAILMSVWATMFLEGWKRYHAEIAWKWGLWDFVMEDEVVRPEFQLRVRTRHINPVTGKEEPHLPARKRAANWLATMVTVLFFITLVLAAVFGMVVYRAIMMNLLAQANDPKVDSYAFLIISITAAIINLIFINVMNAVYYKLAMWLTRWECPRTQSEFDNSFTFKVFFFQFVNYYASFFYIAFFKGMFTQVPGARDNDGNIKIAGYRLEGCGPAGCFVELVIQLAIITCGTQFINAAVELLMPIVMSLINKWKPRLLARLRRKKDQESVRRCEERQNKLAGELPRWEADCYLIPLYDQYLFDEYLGEVIQFGFVTLFVCAFPLAPLFALVHNILEIRVDAYKFVVTQQRPVSEQARNIGVWYNILDFISKTSVTINALAIAFATDFIPKWLYYYSNGNMNSYVDSSLSWFDTSHLRIKNSTFADVTACRYRAYREPPCSLNVTNPKTGMPMACDDDMDLSYEWWKVFAIRLLFVLIFEHIVFVLKMFFDYIIPDVPKNVFIQQQREKYIIRMALLDDWAKGGDEDSRAAAEGDNETTAYQPGSFTQEIADFKPIDHNDRQENPLTNTSSSIEMTPIAGSKEDNETQPNAEKIPNV